MTDPQFHIAFRGYEPTEVDQAVGQLRKALAETTDELGRTAVELVKVRTQVSELGSARDAAQERAEAAEQQMATAGRPTYEELGQTVGRILTLAEKEAASLRAEAQAEAETVVAEAEAAAASVIAAAEREASEAASKSRADATRTLADAKRQADDILDHADRESSARRAEAEAVYENQRQRATAAAADFEQTLAARRDASARDFEEQFATQAKQLADTTARSDAAEAEATRLLDEAHTQSRTLLEAAQAEASQLVTSAKAAAERVRRDSERELAAATQRRDSITAQLSNVRQMLATLGQGVAASVAEVETPLVEGDDETTEREIDEQ